MFGRRSVARTAYAATSAAVVLLAVAAHVQPVKKADLNDGGVWLSSGKDRSVGRYIKSIGQLDASISPRSNPVDLDVLQDGSEVLTWDRSAGVLYGVDVRTRQLVGDGAPMPLTWEVKLGGGTLASLSDKGELRLTRVGSGVPDPTTVGAAAAPYLKGFKGPADLAVGHDGSVAVVSADKLTIIRPESGSYARPTSSPLPAGGTSRDVTFVGSEPVVFDHKSSTLLIGQRHVPLALGGQEKVQQPGPAADGVVVVGATTAALVDLSNGAVHVLSRAGDGTPIAPVRVAGCVYIAWSTGTNAASCHARPARLMTRLIGSSGSLVYRVNRKLVELNDMDSGKSWDIDDNVTPTRPLWQKVHENVSAAGTIANTQKLKHSGDNRPPKANPDSYGARVGRATVLHVLDNDTDPEGDLLVVTGVTKPDVPGATAVPAPDGQSVVVTVPSGAQGDVHFSYTIDDGHGKSASATVTVSPRGSSDNQPPRLRAGFEATHLSIAPGGRLRLPVLDDWRDFDGDPLLLTAVSPAANAVATDDGSLLVTAPQRSGPLVITYSVTDGLSAPVPARPLTLQVLDTGSQLFAKPVARPDALRVTVGRSATLNPLENDLPGADATDPQAQLALTKDVPGVPGLQVSTDRQRGVLSVLASRPGTFLLTYEVSFGGAPTATSEIRIDAIPPSGKPGEPVAMPDSAVLHGQKPVLLDVLANDYDPAGGLLVVQDTTADDTAGVSAGVVDGHYLRLVANGSGNVTSGHISYHVSNGRTAAVIGLVSVTILPAAAHNSAPVALDDAVTVRAGDAATVPVLDNDFDPDGDPLTLLPSPISVTPPLAGVTAAVTGRTVRVAVTSAITQARQVSLDYIAQDPSGARARGKIRLSITPMTDASKDKAPQPRDLEARLVAGDTQTLQIPTSEVDPDGDSVAVTGVVVPPAMGRIVSFDADTITYQSYPGLGGTDTFTYEVMDGFGRTGRAVVRLGIVPPGALAAPIAIDDPLVAAPGRLVHIDVTANDIAPPGAHLTVLPLTRFGPVPAGVRLDGNVVTVPVPAATAPPTVVPYAVTSGGGTSAADVIVRGQAKALLPPIAQDDAVSPDAKGTTATVEVLANDDDPDGSRDDLRVSSVNRDAHVDGKRLVVPLGETPRQFAYVITDPDGLVGTAVVHVPAFIRKISSKKAPVLPMPRLRPGAHIDIPAAGSVTVALNALAEDPVGKPLRLTTTNRLSASPASGVHVSASSIKQLTVAAVGRYSGPGAVTFEVTTGTTLQDPNGRTQLLTVPVQVGKSQPTLRCPATPVRLAQGGATTTLDLAVVCHVWVDPADQSSLRLQVTAAPAVAGVTVTGTGSTGASLIASSNAKPGAAGAMTIKVAGTTVTASLPLLVVAAPKATARPVTMDALQAGQSRSVDIAPYVSSPLRDPRLRILGVRQTSGGTTQATSQGTVVTVTPARDTKGTVELSVAVTDVPDQPERQVQVPITAAVQGRPAAPDAPAIQSVGSKQVTLSWGAPDDNGSPIQSYSVDGAGRTVSCQASPCTIDGLTNGTTYRFTVIATNAVGASDASPPSAPATPDAVPGTVTTVQLTPGDGTLAATWQAPADEGTPVDKYQVEIQPAPAAGSLQTVTSPGATFTGLQNGVSYAVRVRAHNAAPANEGFGDWSSPVSDIPFGTPPQMAAPTATGADVPNPASERAITVSWPAANGNGRDITSYSVTQYVDSSAGGAFSQQVDQISGPPSSFGGGSSLAKSFTVRNDGKFYEFTVSATNAGNLSSPASGKSNAVQGAAPPDQVSSVTATDHASGSTAGYDGTIHVSFTIPASNATSIDRVEYQVNGSAGSWPSPGSSGSTVDKAIGGLTNGTSYTVTVRACNDAGKCGPWSSPSNAVVPYGAPGVPDVQANASGTTVNYTWSGGGGNGRAISSYHVCISGQSCRDTAAGSASQTYTYGSPWSISVSATDAAGQTTAAVTKTGTIPLDPHLSVSQGAHYYSATRCNDPSCAYVHVTLTGYAPNTQYTVSLYSNGPSSNAFPDVVVTTDATGSVNRDTTDFYGYPNTSVWATAGGVRSPNYTWP